MQQLGMYAPQSRLPAIAKRYSAQTNSPGGLPHLLWKSPPSSKACIMLAQLAMWASSRNSS
jgi:hypothetical protein